MSSRPIIKKLGIEDAYSVTDLEKILFPRSQWNGYDYNKDVILNNNRYDSQCAIGLFEKNRMAGYFFGCPVGFSNRALSKHEKKIYISEFAILPNYRRYLIQMISTFVKNASNSFPDRPIVAHSTEYYKNKWFKLNDFVRNLGYELKNCTSYRVRVGQEERTLYCIRWEPINITIHSYFKKDRVFPREQLLFYLHRVKYKPKIYLQVLKERFRR